MIADMIEDSAVADMKLVEKPNYYKNLGSVNIDRLLSLVNRMGERLWQAEDAVKENKFDVFDYTQHIVFRFTPNNADPRISYSNPSWEIFKPVLMPIMDAVTQSYGHKETGYSKVMLARLRSGHSIAPHVDGKGSNLVSHKVHIPLITNTDAMFYINGKARHLEAGQAYEVNNIVKHGADNRGSEDRIHLIFEHFDAAASPKTVKAEIQAI